MHFAVLQIGSILYELYGKDHQSISCKLSVKCSDSVR